MIACYYPFFQIATRTRLDILKILDSIRSISCSLRLHQISPLHSVTMASVDELFKKPALPSHKRKLETAKNPDEIYKSLKLNGSKAARSSGQPMVEDGVGADDDVEAGPAMPSDLDDGNDDEEGRFFGGGLMDSTTEAMNYIDQQDEEAPVKEERIDAAWVRKLALNFEKKISKNAELRAKYEDDPQKFMASEADLDAEIKALSILSEHPELYGDFAKLGCMASLVSLLAHENTDIAIDAIEVIGELIDEDVEAELDQWNALVDAMLDVDLANLLEQNLGRFDESVESDRAGVYHVLGILESLSSTPSNADFVGKRETLLSWLLQRSMAKEKPVSQNKQYATEVLAIILQASDSGRQYFIDHDGIDGCLEALSAYRKRDPEKGTEEEEFMENVFDCVTCAADDLSGKSKLLAAEGVELCLIMLRDGKASRPRALRLLDHALGGTTGAECCEKLVEAAGLKPTFTLFMKKQDAQSTEHLLGIYSSMLRLLPGDSAARIRLLGKFVEKNYQKIARLFELRREHESRQRTVDAQIAQERKQAKPDDLEELGEEWLSRRLDAGLYSLQVRLIFPGGAATNIDRPLTRSWPGSWPKTMGQKPELRRY